MRLRRRARLIRADRLRENKMDCAVCSRLILSAMHLAFKVANKGANPTFVRLVSVRPVEVGENLIPLQAYLNQKDTAGMAIRRVAM